MAHESLVGKDCKVTLGADNILGMGNWSIGGGSIAELDDTEFGDDYNQFLTGLITSGNVSFAGLYKLDDTSGQDMIYKAFHYGSSITDIRFYVNDSSYFTPNSTTAVGGGLPAGSPVSSIYITGEPQISSDRSGLMQISFTGKVSGVMRFI